MVQVRVSGAFRSAEDLREMPIRTATGAQLRLGDLAEVRMDYVDPPQVKVRHQGQESVALGISMTKGGDIVALGRANTASLRVREQETWQHCNAHVPPLSTAGASGSDVATILLANVH